MTEILLLKPGLPSAGLIYTAYYILIFLVLLFSLWMIFLGITDPLGSFLTLLGSVSLLLCPIILRIIFGLILKKPNEAFPAQKT